ncbi:phage upper tail fiber protein [Mesorhizobium sp. 131-2-5]|uniref:phage upper tail fiber protein n=1 Tax=unclassified Mesorhizobium TaxID=325217 RepID=UPI00406C4194
MLRCVPSSAVQLRHRYCRFPGRHIGDRGITTLSQADYDALSPPEPATLYLIMG